MRQCVLSCVIVALVCVSGCGEIHRDNSTLDRKFSRDLAIYRLTFRNPSEKSIVFSIGTEQKIELSPNGSREITIEGPVAIKPDPDNKKDFEPYVIYLTDQAGKTLHTFSVEKGDDERHVIYTYIPVAPQPMSPTTSPATHGANN